MVSNAELDALVLSMEDFYRPGPVTRTILRSVLFKVYKTKGELILDSQKRASTLWWLSKGYAREISTVLATGGLRTSWFWFTGDFVFANPFFFSQQASLVQIEAITDCVLLEISFSDLNKMRKEHMDIELLVERMRTRCDTERTYLISELLSLSAKERFEKYYFLHRDLFNVARHKDIADFLRIKDDGFNRFKK
ncbi:hypothetical protein [Pedobacter agri]|uniref:Crp/Fnr family transcriptional regulator n=1 Tax=Pedobacter agri TaxID=454586 RepID=UPI00292DAE49|nr:hypothetical protein [Pedobacter agri]